MEAKDKITEQPSHFDHLEQMSVGELLQHINEEDAVVAEAVRKVIPQIQAFVEGVEPRMKQGGFLNAWTAINICRPSGNACFSCCFSVESVKVRDWPCNGATMTQTEKN